MKKPAPKYCQPHSPLPEMRSASADAYLQHYTALRRKARRDTLIAIAIGAILAAFLSLAALLHHLATQP